jgi:hypothetical protein
MSGFYFIAARSTSRYLFAYFAHIESKTASKGAFTRLVLPQLTVPPAGRNYLMISKTSNQNGENDTGLARRHASRISGC